MNISCEEEEPLAGDATIVKCIFALELDHEPLAEERHMIIAKLSSKTQLQCAHVVLGVSDQAHRWLASEGEDLPPVVALVPRRVCVDR